MASTCGGVDCPSALRATLFQTPWPSLSLSFSLSFSLSAKRSISRGMKSERKYLGASCNWPRLRPPRFPSERNFNFLRLAFVLFAHFCLYLISSCLPWNVKMERGWFLFLFFFSRIKRNVKMSRKLYNSFLISNYSDNNERKTCF